MQTARLSALHNRKLLFRPRQDALPVLFLFVITERCISSSKILLCGRKTVFGIDIEIYLDYFRLHRRFVFFESIPFGAVSFCFLSEKCKLLFEILTIGDLSVTLLFCFFCSSQTFCFFFAFLVEFFLRKA